MFYQVDRSYGSAEVYGETPDQRALIDPHRIFSTKGVGYDNSRRNLLIGVAYRERAADFCRYLRRKFPEYPAFEVAYAHAPDIVDHPDQVLRQVLYRCE